MGDVGVLDVFSVDLEVEVSASGVGVLSVSEDIGDLGDEFRDGLGSVEGHDEVVRGTDVGGAVRRVDDVGGDIWGLRGEDVLNVLVDLTEGISNEVGILLRDASGLVGIAGVDHLGEGSDEVLDSLDDEVPVVVLVGDIDEVGEDVVDDVGAVLRDREDVEGVDGSSENLVHVGGGVNVGAVAGEMLETSKDVGSVDDEVLVLRVGEIVDGDEGAVEGVNDRVSARSGKVTLLLVLDLNVVDEKSASMGGGVSSSKDSDGGSGDFLGSNGGDVLLDEVVDVVPGGGDVVFAVFFVLTLQEAGAVSSGEVLTDGVGESGEDLGTGQFNLLLLTHMRKS